MNVITYGKVDKTREYIWKAVTEKDRDFWVKGLKEHIQCLKKMVIYLGKEDFDE